MNTTLLQEDTKITVHNAEHLTLINAESLSSDLKYKETVTRPLVNQQAPAIDVTTTSTTEDTQPTHDDVQTPEPLQTEEITVEKCRIDSLLPESRSYNIDISPKILFSRGPEVSLLITSGVSKYMEFKSVDNTYLFLDNNPQLVMNSNGIFLTL
jgi:hypothetical protein